MIEPLALPTYPHQWFLVSFIFRAIGEDQLYHNFKDTVEGTKPIVDGYYLWLLTVAKDRTTIQ